MGALFSADTCGVGGGVGCGILESNVSTFSVIVTEYYQPSTGGRPYQSDRVVATMLTEVEAKLLAAEYNSRAVSGQYYWKKKELASNS